MADTEIKGIQTLKVVTDNLPEEVKRAALDIKVDADSYRQAQSRGVSLTGILESLDPSKPGDHMDAFERQLCKQGIKIGGAGVDTIERFFQTFEDTILFPEFIARQVVVGQNMVNNIADIVALRTKIDGTKYTTLYMDEDIAGNKAADKRLVKVEEYAELPGVKIKTGKQSVTIEKYGRYIQTSYEFLRRQKIDLVAIFFQAMGMQIQKDKFAAAMDVLINGDGNSNGATSATYAAASPVYGDMLSFVLTMQSLGYTMNRIIAPLAEAIKIYSITEFNNALVAGLDQAKTGQMPKPLGIPVIIDLSGKVAANSMVGIDNRFALQEIYETEMMSEVETVIRSQFKGTAVSEVCGFAKIMPNAVKILAKA